MRIYRDSSLPTNNLDELYNQELRIKLYFLLMVLQDNDQTNRIFFLSIIKVKKKMVSQRPCLRWFSLVPRHSSWRAEGSGYETRAP